MTKILIVISTLILLSCSHKPKNIIELGEILVEDITTNNDFQLEEFALRHNIKIDKIEDFGIETAKKFIGNNKIFFADTNTKNPTLFPTNFGNVCSNAEELIDMNDISLYFKENSVIKFLGISFNRDSLGIITLNYIDTANLINQCAEYSAYYNKNKCLKAVDFRALPGRDQMSFKSAAIYLKNTSDKKIDSLLFQCQLSTFPKNHFRAILAIEDYDLRNPFYSKTITYNVTIHPNEIAKIELPDINSFYTSREITQENLGISFQTISSYPKPKIFYCEKINYLDSILKN